MSIAVECINPFLESTGNVFKQVCNYSTKLVSMSKSQVKVADKTMFIMFGITGEVVGQVLIVLQEDNAKQIAAVMMGDIQVTELDEIAKSAVGELGNMIMGNAATILAGKDISVDITPPIFCVGSMEVSSRNVVSIEAVVSYSLGTFNMYFLLQQKGGRE